MEPKRKKSLWKEEQDKIILAVAGIAALAVLYFMFVWNDSETRRDSPVVASMSTVEKVRRRHAHNLSWGNVKGDQAIYLRDIVYVPKGVRATITLKSNKVVHIPEDTMIQFDETTLENMEVLLENFRLLPLKRPSSKMNALLEDIRPLELRLTEISSRMFEVVFKTLNLGRIEKNIKPESGLSLLDYELHLISPVTDRYNLSANRWMRMSWTPIPIPGVKFKLEMSKDKSFGRSLSYKTDKNILLTQFDEEGLYHWKVRATYKNDTLDSEVWNFNMLMRGGRTPGRVALRKPTSAQAGLRLEIATDPEFTKLVRSSVGKLEKCPTGGLVRGVYYCRVLTNSTSALITTYRFEVN